MTRMSRIISIYISALITLTGCLPATSIDTDPLCREAVQALPIYWRGGRDCVSVAEGVVVGRRQEAAGIAPLITDAYRLHVHHFKKRPPRLIFIVGTDVPVGVQNAAQLSGAIAFNWPTMRGQRKAFISSMRAEVDATFAHAPKRTREALLEKMVAGFEDNISDDDRPSPFEAGTIRHELGHQFFMATFVDGAPSPAVRPSGSQYGTTAPDWIDEASAILMENEYLSESRRRQFREMAASAPTVKDLVSRAHPVQQRADDGRSVSQGNITIRTQINDRRLPRDVTQDSSWFYAMTRAFVDFLVSKTMDQAIIASIADEVAAGGDFRTWLLGYERRSALGSDLDGVEREWANWVAQNSSAEEG